MIVVPGIRELEPAHGRLFIVLGVFDGVHLGHLYLLDQLRSAAAERAARPTVITFDHHPDEILTGTAPPLLLDPAERLRRLADAGVEVTVVQHFDQATRETPYDAFVKTIAERVDLAGFLMTPESAFGFERAGTPAAVAALGRECGFDVVVAPTLELGGRPVRSAEIRDAIMRGELDVAAARLGRPYAIAGTLAGSGELAVDLPVALPPPGRYPVAVEGRGLVAQVRAGGSVRLDGDPPPAGHVRVAFG
jgi:riboflavin kinase / FMN adenylyltransferase